MNRLPFKLRMKQATMSYIDELRIKYTVDNHEIQRWLIAMWYMYSNAWSCSFLIKCIQLTNWQCSYSLS